MKQLLALAARNHVFATLLKICLLVGGYLATRAVIREFLPDFSSDVIQVVVKYPGGNPEEIEEGICLRLEEAVKGIEGIKRVYTAATEGVGSAYIELEEGISDPQRVFNDVRNQVEAIQTFPEDAERPIVSQLVVRLRAILVCLYGDVSEGTLKEYGEDTKDELLRLPGVARVGVGGVRPYEIAIEVSEERLRQYGLSLGAVAEAVRRGALNLPGGTVFGRRYQMTVRTVGRRYYARQFADLIVVATPDGRMIPLREIADVGDTFQEVSRYGVFNGKRGVILTVYKDENADAIEVADRIKEFVKQKAKELPKSISIAAWCDFSRVVRDRLNLLVRNGIMGGCLVFASLLLFLGLRLSFWVTLGIPVSFAGALIVMFLGGMSLNLISLFALIMALGIIVDDAIIVGEAIALARERGAEPYQAAVKGVWEVSWPVVAAVTTTIIAFIPLGFVKGTVGKFIWAIPATVIPALATSLFESLFLLPAHLSSLPPSRKEPPRAPALRLAYLFREGFRKNFRRLVERLYVPFLRGALRRRYLAALCAVSAGAVTVGLFAGGHIKFVFFPELDTEIIKAEIEFPPGTPASETQKALRELSEALLEVGREIAPPGLETVVEGVWASVGRFPRTLPKPEAAGDHEGWVIAELAPTEKRRIHSEIILGHWRRKTEKLRRRARSLSFGSAMERPGGEPIEIRLFGKDTRKLQQACVELEQALERYDGVWDVRDDFSGGRPELRFRLKDTARPLGVTLGDLALQVKQAWYGEEALRIQRGRDDVRIKVRYPEAERRSLSQLERMRIRTPDGREIPLEVVADVAIVPGWATILRENGLRRIVVTAKVDTAVTTPNEVLRSLRKGKLPELQSRFGITYSLEGQAKEERKSIGSLMQGFAFALLGILLVLAAVFRSYAQPFLILTTVPMGLIGAVVGHILLGFDISIMSLFGVVALAGIVVNDAIVLIERFNENLADGMPFEEALVSAASRRFRAIILTTVTTCLGLMPLIAERSLQAQFLIPMAIAITFGVAFATLLTLVILPCFIVILNDIKCALVYLRSDSWPDRAEVEPGRFRRAYTALLVPLALVLLPAFLSGCLPGFTADEANPVWEQPAACERCEPVKLPPVLSVEEAKRLALERNPDIAAAAARVSAARARAFKAFGAYLPTLQASFNYTHTFNMPRFSYFRFLPQDFEEYQTLFEGTFLLFDGFVREFTYRASQRAVEESRAALEDTRRLIALAVEQTYYEAQLAAENLRIAEADAQFNQSLLEETQKRYKVGRASRSDVYNFEIRLKAAQSSALQARRALELNYIFLEELLSLEEGVLGSKTKLEELGPEPEGLLAEQSAGLWLDRAEAKRPDLKQLRMALQRADDEIKAALSSFLPSVLLTGQFGFRDLDRLRYVRDTKYSALLLNFGWVFFDRGRKIANYKEARAKRDETAALLRRRRLSVFKEVRKALAVLREAQKQVALTRRTMELAGLTRDLVQKEYKAGKASLTRLNEAQHDFVQAQARYAQSRIRLRQAWAVLLAQAGSPDRNLPED